MRFLFRPLYEPAPPRAQRKKPHYEIHFEDGNEDRLEMAGESAGAIENYHAAAARTASFPERNYLLAQAARLAGLQGR